MFMLLRVQIELKFSEDRGPQCSPWSQVALDSWRSYRNAVQTDEILPDPVYYTAESSDCALCLTGQWVQSSPSCTDLSGPCEDPGQSPGQEAWGL